MATVEGLNQRGSRWSLLVLIPKDLQASYGGKTKINTALGTSDKADAVRKGLRLRAQWLDEFEAKRKALNPQALEIITPELAQVLADEARKKVLQADQELREGKDTPYTRLWHGIGRAVRRHNSIYMGTPPAASESSPVPKRGFLEGLSEWDAHAIEKVNALRSDEVGKALARWDLKEALPAFQADAKAMGISFTMETEGLQEALEAYLQSYRLACKDATLRDAGEVVPTPSIATAARPAILPTGARPQVSSSFPVAAGAAGLGDQQSATEGETLRDIYDQWLKDSPKTKDTAQACLRSLDNAEKCLGSPLYVQKVTRTQGNTFKAWLQEPERGISPKTAKDRLMYVNSLLRFACVELEAIQKNPWQGLSIEDRKTTTRRPWKDEELHRLFSQPLFQAYEVPPKGRTGGGPAAYWIPIIGLYTGARIGELAQLRVSDITTEDGIPIIKITDEGEDQKVKTSASRRSIPIHPELIRLGLLDYAVDIRKQDPNGNLWPLLKSANTASAWFSKYRKSIGLDGRWLDFHSLRHTVRTRLYKAGISEKVMDAITGHETGGSTGRKVYTHLQMNDLQQAVEQLSYDSVGLPRVYPQGKEASD